jgi:cell division septation protein DedD
LDTPPVDEKGVLDKEAELKAVESAGKKSKEASEEPMSAKLSEMKGEFTIQVVAYREKKEAVEMVKRLEFAGYPSFMEKYPMKGGDLYSVRIGRYPTRDAAHKAVKTFASQLQEKYFIAKVRGN